MYNEKILEIFKNPECAGGLQGANGVGKYIDEGCGDYVKIYLKIDEKEEIIDAHFKTMGSVGTIVASSVIANNVIGLSIKKAQNITASFVTDITGAYPNGKEESIEYALNALKLAIENFNVAKAKAIESGKPVNYATKEMKSEPKKPEKQKVEPKDESPADDQEKTVSNAKRAFDAMFEAWED